MGNVFNHKWHDAITARINMHLLRCVIFNYEAMTVIIALLNTLSILYHCQVYVHFMSVYYWRFCADISRLFHCLWKRLLCNSKPFGRLSGRLTACILRYAYHKWIEMGWAAFLSFMIPELNDHWLKAEINDKGIIPAMADRVTYFVNS